MGELIKIEEVEEWKNLKYFFEFEPYDDWSKADVKEMVETVIDPIYHLGDASVGELDVEEIEVEEWKIVIVTLAIKIYIILGLQDIERCTEIKKKIVKLPLKMEKLLNTNLARWRKIENIQ